jgi:hypothetical protein
MKNQNVLMGVAGFVILLGIVYGATYVVGKAWSKSQEK